MPGTPPFPLSGGSLSKNVQLDRICLVENTVNTLAFPVGQYVFFTKSNSIWYRYTNSSTPWTNDILWVANARESNVKFDANGYPFTTFISNSDDSINIKQFVSGTPQTKPIAPLGRYPTVVIDPNDTYIFWVPVPYVSSLGYAQGCDGFLSQRSYNLTPPSAITMLNIEYLPDRRWVFTFTCDASPKNHVYSAFTTNIA